MSETKEDINYRTKIDFEIEWNQARAPCSICCHVDIYTYRPKAVLLDHTSHH